MNDLSNHKADVKIIASDLNFGNIYCKFPTLLPKPLDASAPDLYASFGFNQLIDIPTRVTEKTVSLVDLIFIDNETDVQCHGTLPKISDHDGIFVSLSIKREKLDTRKKIIYDYKNVNEPLLIKYIKDYDYENKVFSLPYFEQPEALTRILVEALEKFVPAKTITIRANDVPWQNSYTRLLLRKKNRNYQIFKRINSSYLNAVANPNSSEQLISVMKSKKEKAFAKSKLSSQESTKANRRVKQAFFKSVNDIMHNVHISAKKKFNILTKLMKNQKMSNIPQLINGDIVVNDPKSKSNIFNDLFAAKATVNGDSDQVPVLPENENIMSSLSSLNTSPIEVAKFCRDIKKSNSSYCGIPGKFLFLIATPVSFPLYKLLNNMFDNGHFPDIFKISHVTAIWKKSGSKSDPAMYRPISLLPTLSKIMESVMHRRLLDHMSHYNIISSRQAAYLKGDSTVQQLLYIVNLIKKSWTNGNITQGVFLDVSAAFDKCWHSGILAKLKQNKVDGRCLDLFESYLRGRKQIVVVDDVRSEIKEITAGIPQGSRLGPLLWILYVNDIIENLESEVLLFADDTCLFASASDPAITAEILNRDLFRINSWATSWKVTFNPHKSKDIIFSRKLFVNNSPPLIFNSTFVERVHEHKHLGLWLNNTLSWSRQISETVLKANYKLSVLRSVKFLDRSTLDLLYKLTVRSVLDYGLVVYYNALTAAEISRLRQLQYRAAKLCTGTLHLTSQASLEKDLAWESIGDRALFLGLSLFHKIHINQTRPLIKTAMPKAKSLGVTRSSDSYNYQTFPPILKTFSDSFFPYFTKKWNELPTNLKFETDIQQFKENLKIHVKPKRHRHFNRGSKRGNSLLTQLRVGRSQLNAHRFGLGLSETNRCLCDREETVSHFLNHCFLFQEERHALHTRMCHILPNFNTLPDKMKSKVLLEGINLHSEEPDSRNIPITLAVQSFILQTKRFN